MTCCVVLLYFIHAVCYYIRINLDIKDSINVLASYFPYVLTIFLNTAGNVGVM